MAKRFKVLTEFTAINKITAPVSKMQNSVRKFTRTTRRNLKTLDRAFTKFGASIKRATGTLVRLATVGIGAVVGAITVLMREFSKFENAEAAFTPLLGGVEKAKLAVKELTQTAATTPFRFTNLQKTMSFLLPVMKGDIDNTIKSVRMLGDTAQGNAAKLDSITRGYTKAMLKNKPDMESLNMIAEAGVPIFEQLAKSMGVTTLQMFELSRQRRITSQHLTDAFVMMTSKGGIFYKGMEIASKTLTGRISTLMDLLSILAAKIGSAIAPRIKELVELAIKYVKNLTEWAMLNKDLIASKFDEYFAKAVEVVKKLVIVIRFLVEHRVAILRIIMTIGVLVASLKVLIGVMTLVNIVMMANTVGLIIVGIGILIASIAAAVIWWDKLKAVITKFANTKLGKAMERIFSPIVVPLKLAWKLIQKIKSAVMNIPAVKGFADEWKSASDRGTSMISPQARIAKSIEESTVTNNAEITLTAGAGTVAEVTGGELGRGLTLIPTGG